jgi:hypothetical protein
MKAIFMTSTFIAGDGAGSQSVTPPPRVCGFEL